MIRRRCVICNKIKRTTNKHTPYVGEECIKKVFWKMYYANKMGLFKWVIYNKKDLL